MRHLARLFSGIGSVFLLGGCAAMMNVAPPVTPAMVAASGGSPVSTLETGRRIYTVQCTACHRADPVTKYTYPEWERIVADMTERTKLDSAQVAALLAYIAAAPKAMRVPAS